MRPYLSRSFVCLLVCVLHLAGTLTFAQSIYWKKDHIYAGAGGVEVAVVTPPSSDTTAPSTPTNLTTSNVTATSIQVNWNGSTDSGGSGLSGFKVYRQIGSSGASLPVGTVAAVSGGTSATYSYIDAPLQPATSSISYVVRAFDNAQNHSSPSTATTAVTTSAWTGETTAPSPPPNLKAWSVVYNKVQLEWGASSDAGGSGVAGYQVYRDGSLISGSSLLTAQSYEDNTVAPNVSYAYRLVAKDNAGNASAQTYPVSVTTALELWFKDDFNRVYSGKTCTFGIDSDTTGCLDNSWVLEHHSSTLWAGTASCRNVLVWYFVGYDDDDEEIYELGDEQPSDCRAWRNLAAGRFRATVTIGSGSAFMFWRTADTAYYTVRRRGSNFTTLSLEYNDGSIISQVTTSSSETSLPITVEADSTTGRVKVFVGTSLKIDVTETNTSRRSSSSWVGVWSPSGDWFDDFILYKLP